MYTSMVSVFYRFYFQSRFGDVDFVNNFMLNILCFSLHLCRLFQYLFYRYVTSTPLGPNVMFFSEQTFIENKYNLYYVNIFFLESVSLEKF
jgi:hypothetical protein